LTTLKYSNIIKPFSGYNIMNCFINARRTEEKGRGIFEEYQSLKEDRKEDENEEAFSRFGGNFFAFVPESY